MENVVILGSGPAGWTAAIYAARANLQPTLVTGNDIGGQLMTTTDVENWPGDIAVTGPDLMERLQTQAEHLGVKVVYDWIEQVEPIEKGFLLLGQQDSIQTRSLIVATGATAKYLGLDSETAFKGKGVSACATCDGFFFKDQNVAVIGGGNVAVEEALYLSNIAQTVYLVHRRDTLRAEKVLQNRLNKKIAEGRIVPIWNHTVKTIEGTDTGVTSIVLQSTIESTQQDISVQGVFIAIGHTPNSQLFQNWLEMDNGFLKVGFGTATQTSHPGIFAAGDVADSVYRQAVTSAGTGCMAALDAERYLIDLE